MVFIDLLEPEIANKIRFWFWFLDHSLSLEFVDFPLLQGISPVSLVLNIHGVELILAILLILVLLTFQDRLLQSASLVLLVVVEDALVLGLGQNDVLEKALLLGEIWLIWIIEPKRQGTMN